MKIIKSELHQFGPYFDDYHHNIPVIYSALEGQYQGVIYTDEEEDIIVLVTQFDFIFLGGNIGNDRAEYIIHDIIFNELVKRQGRKEIILFAPSDEWFGILDQVFHRHNGVCDMRKCYRLNQDKFNAVCSEVNSNHVKLEIDQECENGSAVEYPVSRVYLNESSISYCSAFMIARGHAEIDVATEEAYRQKGYAKIAAISLIKELIQKGYEPNWCTWPYRFESQALAQSIGFELDKEVPAYIWVEEFEISKR
jgi:hypothetical protein